MDYTRVTEIRKIKPAELIALAAILNQPSTNPAWRKLMQNVPDELIDAQNLGDAKPKYNSKHIRSIENDKRSKTAAEIFLDEWSTTGRIRPTLSHLLQLLINCEMFRAADYVAINLLREAAPQRPNRGPAVRIDISFPQDEEQNYNLNGSSPSIMANLNNGHIQNKEHQSKEILGQMSMEEARQPVQSTDVTTSAKAENCSIQTPASRDTYSDSVSEASSDSIHPHEQANAITPQTASTSLSAASQRESSSTGNLPNISILNIASSETNYSVQDEFSGLPKVSILMDRSSSQTNGET